MIGIKMPTLAFGQKQRQIPKSELIKEYKNLYYEEPEINWKQRESNKFTLTMCSIFPQNLVTPPSPLLLC